MVFPTSRLATQYLKGLKGIEIGPSFHNKFDLDTINADKKIVTDIYVGEQQKFNKEISTIHVWIEDATKTPFGDKSFDFVLTSHVLEHVYNPELAIKEWARIAKKYIFLIIPHKDRTFDKDRDETTVEEIYNRRKLTDYPDKHWNVWKLPSFIEFIKNLKDCVEVVTVQDPDDKVGNGFTVILKPTN